MKKSYLYLATLVIIFCSCSSGGGDDNGGPDPEPALNSEINVNSTTLNWTTSDVDNDALTFDVYLDTNSNPITKVSENQYETIFRSTGLTSALTYYLKWLLKLETEELQVVSKRENQKSYVFLLILSNGIIT